MNCKPTSLAPPSDARSLCSSKPARQTTRFCNSQRRKEQTKVWFSLQNIKLPGAVSVAIVGNRRSAKVFGFQSFYDQKFQFVTLGASPFGRSRLFRTSFEWSFLSRPRPSCRTIFVFRGAR